MSYFKHVVTFVFVLILVGSSSGFVRPGRQTSFSRTTLLRSEPENKDLTPTECVPCNTGYDSAKRCDLETQLNEDLEAGAAMRNEDGGFKSNEPTLLNNVTQTLLNNTFVLFDTSILKNVLLNGRSYARVEPFETKNLGKPPVVEDLLPDPTRIQDSFYLSFPAAFLTFFGASVAYPVLAGFLVQFITTPPELLDSITSKLVPGISILYGTFISLTLSILYNRQRQVQDSVAQETSLLSFLLHNFVSLFKQDRSRMIRAGQCAADQVRILMRESRGLEYMTIIYTDPYIGMLHLIEEEEERLVESHGNFLSKGPVLGTCRDTIKDLRKIRASRLSDEALALPPTHFYILKMLTFLLLLGYFISAVPTVEAIGYTPVESSLLFGILCSVYLLFDCFANDLNDLYNGVFQVRRGSSATHLLEIKKVVSDHPWLRFGVNFERVNTEVRCFYPGLAELWFEGEQTFTRL